MYSKFKFLLTISAIIVFFMITSDDLAAQCPMCRLSAEQNLKDGGTAGKGLNKGILYMLSLPYLLVGTLGYIWWRNKRRLSDEIYDPPFSEN